MSQIVASRSDMWKLVLCRSATVSADQILELTILWLVWNQTQSSTLTSLATFAGRAPLWIFGLVGAFWTDHYGPRKTVGIANIVAAVFALLGGMLVMAVPHEVVLLIVVVFVINCARAIEPAAFTSIAWRIQI